MVKLEETFASGFVCAVLIFAGGGPVDIEAA